MLPPDFVKTIYLGDRACKSINIEGWTNRVVIQVDEISRIRDESGNWNFYNEENIVDGRLVFSEVRSVLFDPSGPIPNDYISRLEAESLPNGYYQFSFSAASVDQTSKSTEVLVTIVAKRLHLEDPSTPGDAIES
jgi:hypothetical protein